MRELIQADLKRVIKDKLLLVLAILAVVFALITPLTFALVFSVIDVSEEPMLSELVSAKGMFFQSFSMTNNMGFIAPILLAIVLYKDFSYGTVRNKIISGKSRSQIFLSTFIVCSLVLVCLIMLSAFITLGVSLIFFRFAGADAELAKYIILAVILGICSFFGDITESGLKRVCGVKDSGNWIPGMGGAFDVLDSFIYVGIVVTLINIFFGLFTA